MPRFDEPSPGKRYKASLHFYPTVEFLTEINGVSFEQAWPDSVETTFGEENLTAAVESVPAVSVLEKW